MLSETDDELWNELNEPDNDDELWNEMFEILEDFNLNLDFSKDFTTKSIIDFRRAMIGFNHSISYILIKDGLFTVRIKNDDDNEILSLHGIYDTARPRDVVDFISGCI
jgi:hypothetical protein